MIRKHSGELLKFSLVAGEAVRVGVWDQFMTWGDKSKDGSPIRFDELTLGQIVSNFASRKNLIGCDFEHQTANAPINGQPAPQLAFYNSLAVIRNEKVIAFASRDSNVLPPNSEGKPDGLYGYRCEITPLGQQLLPNYKFYSPMFTTEGADEQGNPIGYDLMNVSAVSVPFQDACEITFDKGISGALVAKGDRIQMDGDDYHVGDTGTVISVDPVAATMEILWDSDKSIRPVALTVLSGSRWHLIQSKDGQAETAVSKTVNIQVHSKDGTTRKVFNMNDKDLMARLGLDESADPDAMKAAFKAVLKRMDDDSADMKKKMDDDAAEMKKKMDDSSDADAAKMDDAADADAMDDVDMDDDAALKKMKKSLGLSAKAKGGKVLAAFEAKFVPMSELASLQKKLEVIELDRAVEKQAAKVLAVEAFVTDAITLGKYPTDKADKLRRLAQKDMEVAVEALFEEHTFGALRRYTAAGKPISSELPTADESRSAGSNPMGWPEIGADVSKEAHKLSKSKGIDFASALLEASHALSNKR